MAKEEGSKARDSRPEATQAAAPKPQKAQPKIIRRDPAEGFETRAIVGGGGPQRRQR